MSRRVLLQLAGGIAVLALLAWVAALGLERLMTPTAPTDASRAPAAEPPEGVPRITATLYYGTPDGQGLVGVRREIPLAEGTVPQGREILLAQLQGAPEGYVSVIPSETMLRAFYVTDRGDAFVDLSAEAAANHPGGSFTEMLTVYAIVNAVTTNLPAIDRVQILIDGREPESLAGHVDLRRPLEQDLSFVREP